MSLPSVLSATAPPERLGHRSGYQWFGALPFLAAHALPLLALGTGVRWHDWLLCALLYAVRMFGVTAGYHRYFAHHSFRTSRAFQLLLALLAMSSSQKGVLWWAAHHRAHHAHSDRDGDPHDSRRGFWYSHLGWIFDHTEATDFARVRKLARYPELRWLNRYWLLPPLALGLLVWAFAGWSGLWIGFFLSTVLLWHGTFTINSLSHLLGRQRYATGDESRNHWLLALITLGEGWHNNHHHYMRSTRQGFYWWELDLTYGLLRALAAVGLVWDLHQPPPHVYDPARQLPATRAPHRRAPTAP